MKKTKSLHERIKEGYQMRIPSKDDMKVYNITPWVFWYHKPYECD